jgi:hypothetical protein
MTTRLKIALLIANASTVFVTPATGFTYTPLNYPGALETFANGVSGGKIVGHYDNAVGQYHGFIYDGNKYASLDFPSSLSTVPIDIDGNNVVGYYVDSNDSQRHGFLYMDGIFSTVDDPSTGNTFNGCMATGISGTNIVGNFSGPPSGYVFDGSQYKTLNPPLSLISGAAGIDGHTIVGSYSTNLADSHGFIFDGSTYTTLDFPTSSYSGAANISGNRIVGFYQDSKFAFNGYLYDGNKFTTLDVPHAFGTDTTANGIDGNIVVGQYYDSAHLWHGFMTIIPEPSTAALLVIGCVVALVLRRRF